MNNDEKEILYTLRWYINNHPDQKKEMLTLISRALGEAQTQPTPLPERETPPPDAKSEIHLAIVVGHEKNKPGAEFNGDFYESEYEFNSAIAELVKTLAGDVKVSIVYRDGIGISGAYKKVTELNPDLCVELHFNAYNEKAFGSETLHSPDPMDKTWADIIHKKICVAFERGGNSRGLKALSKSDRGAQSCYALTRIPNCLVEPFFGDNPSEASYASTHMKEYALSILDAVRDWKQKFLS